MQKAMIFSAGLGSRLKPLTNERPKALVEINGKSMLQRTVDKLTHAGISSIVINIHHFPELMFKAIAALDTHGAEIVVSDESDLLLDTGGGLLKASRYLMGSEPVVLHNVDVVSDIDLRDMYENHCRLGAMASLAVSSRLTSRYFLWDNDRLCGWKNNQTNEQIYSYSIAHTPVQKAFSGIHLVNPEIFNHITEEGIFSINKIYLRLAKDHKIIAYNHDPKFWADMGSIDKLRAAEKLLQQHPNKF